MDDESCYAAIRLTQKGQPTQNVPLTYPRKKFDPRKITHAKLSVKRTHDPRKYTHDPRKVTHVPRPTTHDPRSFSNPRDPRNPRNLAHSKESYHAEINHFAMEFCSMKLKGQIGECPRRFLKFLRKIRTAVAFTRSVFLTWASIYSCKQLLYFSNIYFGKKYVVSLFRYFVSRFRGFVVYKQPKSNTVLIS